MPFNILNKQICIFSSVRQEYIHAAKLLIYQATAGIFILHVAFHPLFSINAKMV